MSDWSEGYVKGIDYTYHYYRELNPFAARLPLLHAGYAPFVGSTGVCCELGFGFGVSTNIHAAASTGEWWGTDFNPSQAGFARDLGRVSGAKAQLFDQSFEEFCCRSDLPDFDFIGVHGTWSWVSDENRRLIVDFVRRRLRLGGVLYISYNTQPGWAQMVPVRQVLMEHAETMNPPGESIEKRIDSAIGFFDALLAASPGYAAINPLIANRIQSLKGMSRNYLAHEYFNRDWQPMLFSEFSRLLEPAKVTFACSALSADHFDPFNLSPEQTRILGKISDVRFRESARDVMINRHFRQDYWIKGPRPLEARERLAALRAHPVILAAPPEEMVFKAGGAFADVDLPAAVYNAIIELLIDRQAHSLGQLEDRLNEKGISFGPLLEAVLMLAGKGYVASVQDQAVTGRALETATRLNRHLIENSGKSSGVHVLASPVTGGGVTVQSFHQQMLLARSLGFDRPEQWAEFIRKDLAAKGVGINNSRGGVLSEEESREALAKEAHSFATRNLPILQALGIAR